jgi:hypothetical protein
MEDDKIIKICVHTKIMLFTILWELKVWMGFRDVTSDQGTCHGIWMAMLEMDRNLIIWEKAYIRLLMKWIEV